MKSRLYLVATPIGNYADITLRALYVLKNVDFIICEELREARRFLSHYHIQKELIPLNEHNESEAVIDIIARLLEGNSAALISDCGTPLFSDPGHLLVNRCIEKKIEVIPVPGTNSLLPALTVSGFDVEKFYYYGWLSPKKEVRRKELLKLKNLNEVIVLLDTPYRLKALLSDIVKIIGDKLPAVLAFQLTMEDEKFYRGTIGNILKIAVTENLKGEFVLILNNRRK